MGGVRAARSGAGKGGKHTLLQQKLWTLACQLVNPKKGGDTEVGKQGGFLEPLTASAGAEANM